MNTNIFAQSEKIISDSDSTISNQKDGSTDFIPLSQFTYADHRRYTMDGSLPRLTTKIKPATMAILGGVYLGAIVFLHIHQQNAWWSGQRGNFHFEEDWMSALQVDKAGHSFGGYFTSYVMSEGLMASGFSWKDATLWGSVFGLAYQTYVETEDGFATEWGFSPSDWYFDALGPLFFLSQHYVPALQNITPKWQYVPSEWTGEPIIGRVRTFIDDYNSSTFWWSVNVYNILPDNLKKYWLPWLNIAVGYGADAVDVKADPNGPPDQLSERRYVIGLDYNLIKLLPDGGSFWNWFRQTLDFIKFPAPAIEFSPSNTKFKLLYPFRINLGNISF
ncbi:MAG: YfiM family protein [Bacteroidetes bacterium]|nr:YfiM family protein [Bacteroidota bacterium]